MVRGNDRNGKREEDTRRVLCVGEGLSLPYNVHGDEDRASYTAKARPFSNSFSTRRAMTMF